MTGGHFSWRHLRVNLRFTKECVAFLSVKFCFTAQDHVVINQPNRSEATVIVVAPSGEAVVSTGKVWVCRLSRFLLFAAYRADAERWRGCFGCF